MPHDTSVLLLTGTVATGKTTIAAEIGEIFPEGARPIVIVDLDQLGWGFIPDAPSDRILKLRTDNLAAIWPNLRSAGFPHVVISGAISTLEELQTDPRRRRALSADRCSIDHSAPAVGGDAQGA